MEPGEEIESLVEELEVLIDNGKQPFGSGATKRVVDTQEAFGILDEIREVFPQEFTRAKRIVKEEAEILARAQAQADAIVADAQQQAQIIASDQEIVRLAQQQAEEIRDQAQQYERDTRYNAEEYAENVLAHLEENLKSVVGQVTRCRQTLNESSGPRLGGWQG
jgi:regulator of protease activity HflC (stomatin/prohibitin superfamily)